MKPGRPTVVVRRIFGLLFVAGPLATALHLVAEPALPPRAAAFMGALARTGYMLPLLWSTEIVCGLLLLSGFLVPVALAMLAPVIVNIVAFHVFLAPSAMPPAIVVSALEIFLAWQYREAFRPLFRTARGLQAGNLSEFRVRAA